MVTPACIKNIGKVLPMLDFWNLEKYNVQISPYCLTMNSTKKALNWTKRAKLTSWTDSKIIGNIYMLPSVFILKLSKKRTWGEANET